MWHLSNSYLLTCWMTLFHSHDPVHSCINFFVVIFSSKVSLQWYALLDKLFYLVLVFLQQFVLTVFSHPQTLVQNKLAFLQLHRQVVQPVRHEQEIISAHAFGIGSWDIKTGRNLLSSVLLHHIVTGSGSRGSKQCACFQTSV